MGFGSVATLPQEGTAVQGARPLMQFARRLAGPAKPAVLYEAVVRSAAELVGGAVVEL